MGVLSLEICYEPSDNGIKTTIIMQVFEKVERRMQVQIWQTTTASRHSNVAASQEHIHIQQQPKIKMNQRANTTHREHVKHFLQSSQKWSPNSKFGVTPTNFDTCSSTPRPVIFFLIVIVIIIVFLINCFLISKHQTKGKHELTRTETGEGPDSGGNNV